MAASMAPISVISDPATHQRGAGTTRLLAAPTAKRASKLTAAAAAMAGVPSRKKNGTLGMKTPKALESEAVSAARAGWRR